MKFDKTDVWGFEHAIRGMRNPLDSWTRSDSKVVTSVNGNNSFIIGDEDMGLAQRLIRGGSEHRKFLRQIIVSVDITAPFYWWKEFDTYKIGTVANSCSTMHKLASTPITKECFEMGDFKCFEFDISVSDDGNFAVVYNSEYVWNHTIHTLEALREKYVETKDKRYWKELVRLLPESWLQKRTVTMNYENLLSICKQRSGHKLTEWHTFIDWVHTLPYANEFVFLNENL